MACGCERNSDGSCGCGGGPAYIKGRAKSASASATKGLSSAQKHIQAVGGPEPLGGGDAARFRTEFPSECSGAPADRDPNLFWAPYSPQPACEEMVEETGDPREVWDYCTCQGTTRCDRWWPEWRNNSVSSTAAIAIAEGAITHTRGFGRSAKALLVSAWATLFQNYDLVQWAVCCKSTFKRAGDDIYIEDLPVQVLLRILGTQRAEIFGIANEGDWQSYVRTVHRIGMRGVEDIVAGEEVVWSYDDWSDAAVASSAIPRHSERYKPYPSLIAFDVTSTDWLRPLKRWKGTALARKPKTIADLVAVDNTRRASAVLIVSGILLHELCHVAFSYGHPIVQYERNYSHACDTFNRIQNQFIWSVARRYPELGASECLRGNRALSGATNYDFGGRNRVSSNRWLLSGCE